MSAIGEDSDLDNVTNATTVPDNVSSKSASGAVYVYKRTGSSWAQEAYIKAANSASDSQFGYSVSLDGETIVVGAPYEDSDLTTITNGTTANDNVTSADSGAVYVYKRTGSTWAQEAYIKAVNSNVGDNFGRSVSIDNDTIVVGSHLEDSSETTITNGTTGSSNNDNSASGAVYVFTRNGSGAWAQDAYIKASNNDVDDSFGDVVSIDELTLAVGVKLEDSNQTTITNGTAAASSNDDNVSSGAVYVYE